MYALNSPFAPILAELQDIPACADACDLLIAYESSTLKQVIDALEDLGRLAYLAWFYYSFHQDLELAARLYLLRVARQTPARLVFFYSRLDDLLPAEIAFMLDTIRTTLPAVWHEIQVGALRCGTQGGSP